MKIAICDFELRTLELIKNFVADTDTLGDQPFKILSYENPFDMLAYYSMQILLERYAYSEIGGTFILI